MISLASARKTGNRGWGEGERLFTKNFILICLVSIVSRVGNHMQNTAIPLFIQSVGYSKSAAGLNVTAYSIAALVLRPVMGTLIDRRGRRTVLLFSTALFILSVLGFGAIGFVSALPLIYAMQIICGVAFSGNSVSMTTICTDILPQSRLTEGLGYYGLATTISTAVAPAIVLALINGPGYRVNFWVICCLLFVSFVLALPINYEKRQGRMPEKQAELPKAEPAKGESGGKEAWWEQLVERNSLTPSLIMMLCGFAYSSIITFLPTFTIAFSISNTGLIFAMLAIGQALARITVGRLSAWLGELRIMNLSYIVYFIGMISIFVLRAYLILSFVGFFVGAAFGVVNTVLNSIAIVKTPNKRRGAANATFYMFMDIGFGIGSALWGVVADTAGIEWIYLFSAVFVGIAALLTYFCRRRFQ